MITRRIRDNLHGSIDITDTEDFIINHPYFQRLRRIKQTAFLSYVFPGATHTRFEHSLGVMHLAGVAWNKLKKNQQRILAHIERAHNFKEVEEARQTTDQLYPTRFLITDLFDSEYVLQVLRIAALLHDVGHPALSHSGEIFLPTYEDFYNYGKGPLYLKSFIKQKIEENRGKERVRHEIYSILFIDQIIKDLNQKKSEIKINAQDVSAILLPEIKPVPGSPLSVLRAHYLCHELVSSEIDIDRIDYLLRDSRECGVVYGIFDAERILDSLSLYYSTADKTLHLAIVISGLATFEDYLRSRQSMYVQLYFHKTSVACEAMLKHLKRKIPDWHLPCDLNEYSQIDDFNFFEQLKRAAQEVMDDERLLDFDKKVDQIFQQRKLWKRVYEITEYSDSSHAQPQLEKVKKILKEQKIEHEQIVSANYLTKFSSKEEDNKRPNTLKLIKKDELQFLCVERINEYSRIFSDAVITRISRIYAQTSEVKTSANIKDKIRELLA